MGDITGSHADPPPQHDRVMTAEAAGPNPEVFAGELEEIRKSRLARGVGTADQEPLGDALVGLALSGGGIRSATLCLGVLQSFAAFDKLKLFDYLSTVSGGGYIGASWSALLARSDDGLAEGGRFPFPAPDAAPGSRFEAPSADGRPGEKAQPLESPALTHVRDFANYLVPNGMQDYLRLPALLLGGLLVNALILLPYIVLAAAVTLALWGWRIVAATDETGWLLLTPWAAGIALISYLGSVLLVSPAARRPPKKASGKEAREGNAAWRRRDRMRKFGALLLGLVMILLLAELQPWLIWFVAFSESLDAWGAGAAVGGLSGIISGLLAAVAAVRANPWLRSLALGAVLVLGPLAFWALYVALCVAAVADAKGEPGATGLVWTYVAAYSALAFVLRAITHFVDVNGTALHNRYRDGLSRAFMICLRRMPGGGIGVDHCDDTRLSELAPASRGGPYHLVNATVNLPDFEQSREEGRLGHLGQRGRRSDFFIFSRNYCGNERLGYCPTKRVEESDPHFNLATAMAISAAAASTQMGQKTFNPLFTFLLAMLNVRLGYWLPSPEWLARDHGFRLRVGPLYFLAEAFGWRAKFTGRAVYLTDGGHIENLGVFELLRRRCRYVVAIDAEADPLLQFNGLTTLQRMAFTDLGARIEIDLEDLRLQPDGLSRRHVALGSIHYRDGMRGELLYIKSSVTGSEAEFIREYRSRNPQFPHESTGDQFFDEAQFEAYRALGRKIGNDLLRSRNLRVHDEAPDCAYDLPDTAKAETAWALFNALREWLAPAAPNLNAYLELQGARGTVTDLLFDPAARAPARATFAELETLESRPNEDAPDSDMQEMRLVNRKLQLMERALLALRLDEPRNQTHPRNRGWMNLFRRWSQAPYFRRHWPLSVGNYSEALQTFGKYAFGLKLHAAWQPQRGETLTGIEQASLKLVQERSATDFEVWIGRVSGDEAASGSGIQLAVAAVDRSAGAPVVRMLRVRDTFRGMGLTEPLARELYKCLSQHQEGAPAFSLGGWEDTPAARRLARILRRTGFTER